MGMLPLVTSIGAGAEMRRARGIAVLSGMLGVTALGILRPRCFTCFSAASRATGPSSCTTPVRFSASVAIASRNRGKAQLI